MPPRVLCNAAQDLQGCMAPLMQMDGDEIVEALLLGLTDDRPRMSPTLEEEAILLGVNQEAQEATAFPMNAQKPPNPRNQLSGLMVQAHLPLQPWPQVPIMTSTRTPEKPGAGLDPDIINS